MKLNTHISTQVPFLATLQDTWRSLSYFHISTESLKKEVLVALLIFLWDASAWALNLKSLRQKENNGEWIFQILAQIHPRVSVLLLLAVTLNFFAIISRALYDTHSGNRQASNRSVFQ